MKLRPTTFEFDYMYGQSSRNLSFGFQLVKSNGVKNCMDSIKRSSAHLRRPYSSRSPKPLSEVIKENLPWAIINQGHSDGTIAPTKWKKVEHVLLNIFLEVMASIFNPSPSCRD